MKLLYLIILFSFLNADFTTEWQNQNPDSSGGWGIDWWFLIGCIIFYKIIMASDTQDD
tara:strand:+ start:160 stop:333 length:174 start_codon:yes stop_codon:yes gene_type:complete